jgi:malonate transporter
LSVALLLFPDFALIALGVLLKRYARFELAFWTGLEKLVYFVLFPSLLFNSTSTATMDLASTTGLILACLGAIVTGIVLGYLAKPLFKPAPDVFASSVQCAFRFNSYIALALAGRLAGSEGIALMAIVIGLSVPLANAAAVFALARHQKTNVLGEMMRNPLIIATLGGLAVNLAGIHLPEFVMATVQRLGSASIALGLIAVGAGLRLTGAIVEKPTLAWLLVVKLIAAPTAAWLIASELALPPLQREIAILFAALPAASSAYILAVRMGGNGAVVAFLISASTVLSTITLPIWILVAR